LKLREVAVRPWLTPAVLAFAMAACSANTDRQPLRPEARACALAADVLAQELAHKTYGKPWVVDSEPEDFGRDVYTAAAMSRADWARAGLFYWSEPRPPKELAAKFLKTPARSVVDACPNVRRLLDAKHVGYGRDVVSRIGRDRNGELTAAILSVSLPVVSDDGRAALFQLGSGCGSECGSGATHYYRRGVIGEWIPAGVLPGWIS
jgi:hypothetical protein